MKRMVVGLCLVAAVCVAAPAAGQMAGKTGSRHPATGAGDPERGRQIFTRNGCGWCHEKTGRKAGKGPQLMNSPRSDDYLATRIRTGKQGRMPAFGHALNDQQISDLVAFIRSIKPVGGQ